MVVWPLVLVEFVGFKTKTWYNKAKEITSMDSCFVACIQCLTEFSMQLVPGTVLQLATACVLTAMYAITIYSRHRLA